MITITAPDIVKAKDRQPSAGALLMYFWMLTDGKGSYTQTDISRRYHLSKRSVRNNLYNLIDARLVHRGGFTSKTEPTYIPTKNS